jgi:hypothetical protein
VRTRHIAIVFGIGVTAVAGAFVHSCASFDAEPVGFGRDAWHKLRPEVELSADPGCVLGALAKDLANSGHLNQKSEQYVLEELGQPTKRQGMELVYAVGQCHGWDWRHSELVLQLSSSGTVLKTEIRTSE